jgi:hypothetical protein
MRRATFLFAAAVLVASCGGEAEENGPAPAAPPSASSPPAPAPAAADFAKEGADGARAVVEAYLLAAKVPDEEAMLALGTPEWREKERTWAKGFTVNIVKKGFALRSHEVRELEVAGETAKVSVRAVFLDAGKEDREGMRFSLVRREGRWWISELR